MRHGLADGFYAIYALTVFALMAPLVWVSVVLLPRLSWRWGFMRVAAKLLARLTGTQLTVRGWEHLPPPEQPCVFVANHESYLDGYVLVGTLRRGSDLSPKSSSDTDFCPVFSCAESVRSLWNGLIVRKGSPMPDGLRELRAKVNRCYSSRKAPLPVPPGYCRFIWERLWRPPRRMYPLFRSQSAERDPFCVAITGCRAGGRLS